MGWIMSISQVGSALGAAAPYTFNFPVQGSAASQSASSAVSSSPSSSVSLGVLPSTIQGYSAPIEGELFNDAYGLGGVAARSLSDGTASAGTTADGSGDTSDVNGPASSLIQEGGYLANFADMSLMALGIISPSQGSEVSFSSLSYNVSESAAAGVSQQGGQSVAAFGAEEQAQFVGQGQITANGQTYDFQIEVDVDMSVQAEAATATGGTTQQNNVASSPTNIPLSAPSITGNPSSGASASNGASDNMSGSFALGSSDLLNWNTILEQSQNLLDLLQSMGMADQPAQAGAAGSANAMAGSTATSAATNAASAGATAGSGASQSAASSATPTTQAAQAA